MTESRELLRQGDDSFVTTTLDAVVNWGRKYSCCPPRPEASIDGLPKLQDQVQGSPGWSRPRHRETAELWVPIVEKPVP